MKLKTMMAVVAIISVCSTNAMAKLKAFQNEKGKFGYKDESGLVVIQPQFDFAIAFSYGLAPVKIGKKWGYINEKGEVVIKAQFDHASFFTQDGFGLVELDGEYFFIDKVGKKVESE